MCGGGYLYTEDRNIIVLDVIAMCRLATTTNYCNVYHIYSVDMVDVDSICFLKRADTTVTSIYFPSRGMMVYLAMLTSIFYEV